MAMMALLFLSCVNTEDPTQGATVRLKLTGGIAVNQPADDATRAVSDSESLTVNSMRVLIFNNGALVSNKLFTSGYYTIDGTGNNWIVSMNDNAAYVEARYGKNDVYVVLNEAAGGPEFVETLTNMQTKTAMEALRTGKVAYTNLIAVDNANEPGFLMCVYDEVNIDSTKTTLDMTGLAESSYGFPMRRTMAKVVLESVVGGVYTNNIIVGTSTAWNGNASTDQIPDDTSNTDLIATSAVHILGLDLVNVPTHYSWQQDGDTSTNFPASPTTYRDPIPVAQYTGQNSSEYFARTWPGSITVSGTVKFTRIDQLADIWKVEDKSGTSSYVTIPLSDVNNLEYYNWAITPNTGHGETQTIEASDADKSSYNYSHYTMDSQGIVTLYDTSGKEMKTPSNTKYSLNLGNFTTFFANTYSNNSTENYIPGTPVAGKPEVTPTIDPAVWELNFDDQSYYIPENIPGEEGKYTKLRITASIAIPTAKLSEEEINNALNGAGAGSLVQDEAKLNLESHNIQKYLFAKGTMIRYPLATGPEDDTYYRYAMRYAGLSRKFEGTVSVKSGSEGQYDAITGTTAQKVTIEVPLNNDENATDHNIYRGHEYRVKLYVTKKKANWTPGAEANRSVTYHELPAMTTRGGESDLCIAAEVIATPVE